MFVTLLYESVYIEYNTQIKKIEMYSFKDMQLMLSETDLFLTFRPATG